MDIVDVEKVIELVLSNCEYIKTGIRKNPLYSYYHHGSEFTYIHTITTNDDIHRVLIDGKPIIDINFIKKYVEYTIDGIVINHSLEISEEWHFQLSTVSSLISFEHIGMIREINEIIS